jgi:hypothetical protein
MYAGPLASGWKKKKGIAARRRGSLGAMMGSVPAMMMLGAIACVGISAPMSACSAGIQGGTVEQLLEVPQQKRSNPSGEMSWEELQREVAGKRSLSETTDEKGGPQQKMNQASREEAGTPFLRVALAIHLSMLAIATLVTISLMSAVMAVAMLAAGTIACSVITKVPEIMSSVWAGGGAGFAPPQPPTASKGCKTGRSPSCGKQQHQRRRNGFALKLPPQEAPQEFNDELIIDPVIKTRALLVISKRSRVENGVR